MLAAKAMQQLSDMQRGERFPVKDLSEYLPSTVGVTGVKRQTSDSIAYLLDSGRFSYESIGKALDDIIHNNGQENYAAAKRVELVLDDMLTNGYADVDGRPHGPNETYIAEKSKIPGAEVTEAAPEVDSDYSADLVEDGYDAAQEKAQQRTQETAQEAPQQTQETEAERRKREAYKDVPGLRWKSVPEARVDELLRTGLTELDGQQGVGNDGEVADAWQYSVSETLDSDLQKVLDGNFKGDSGEVYIGETSNFLTDVIGADALTVTMPSTKAYSAMATEEEARAAGRYQPDTNYHGLGKPGLIRALEASENPVAAFADTGNEKSKRSGNIVLVTDEVGADGNIVVVESLGTNAFLRGKRIEANKVITSYDRSALANDIVQAAADGRLLHLDKKRSQMFFAGSPAANSQGAMRNIDFTNNIRNFWANVKWEKSGNRTYASENAESDALPEWKKNLQEYYKQQFSVSEDGKTQDELLDFVTQFQRATEERFRDVPKESAKESAEDNAAAIRGDLDRLAELARQSEEAQGIQRQTPEEIAESKVNARVGEEKPGFMDRLRHPGQTIRDAGESLRRTGENVRDTGRYFYRKLVDSGEAVSRVGKQSGDHMSIENMGLVENARDALAKRISRLQNRCSEKSAIRGSPPTQNHPRRLTERKLPGVCFFSRLKFQVPAELDRVIPKAADAAVGVADVRLAAGVPAYGITEAVRVEALSRFPALLAELALRVVCRLAERLKILQPLGRRRHDAHVVLPAVFVVDLRL